MRVCEVMWDIETADRVQKLEEEAGMPSPCRIGRACPFLPRDIALVPRRAGNRAGDEVQQKAAS